MKLSKYILLGILLPAANVFAQQNVIDSLKAVLKTEKDDTNKVNTLNTLAYSFYTIYPDSTILLTQQALALAEKLGWANGESISYNNAGLGYWVKGDYHKALDYYLKALKMNEKTGNKRLQAVNLLNIGNLYDDKGDYPKALDYYQKALKMDEEIGNKKGQADALGNIGIVYYEQGDYPKALDYFLKTLKMREEMGDKRGQAINLGGIGVVYYDQGDFSKALDYDLKALKMDEETGNKQGQAINLGNIGGIYNKLGEQSKASDYDLKALKMDEEIGDKQGQATDLSNIGGIYFLQCDYPKALDYDQKALKMAEEMGNKQLQAVNLGNIGDLFTKTGKFKEAEKYLKKAIAMDSSIGEKNDLRSYEEKISQLYDTTGRYKPALAWYKKATVLKDTLFNIDKNKTLTRKELTYQFKQQQDSVTSEQAQKDMQVAADKRKQVIIIWSVCGGLLLVMIFAGFIFRSLRITRKQKNIIEVQSKETEEQKKVIEEKNKEVLDSITYAKRLQDAILPPLSIIKKYLPESFLLYKPKDIVAGDFYWLEKAGANFLIAACDCTGHGVPGAMVSVVCSNALNRTVKEFKITEPGKILDKVRELVLETFEKSESEVQDGMDISLCCLNTQTKEIQWSGANNPLWYIQNGELKEVAPDKQPIGKFNLAKPFNTASLKLQKGDILYLFTDGYADQFGGPKGKKFKYKQLQEKLLAVASMSMDKQKEMLNETIESWKGSLEQVDDILIIGIRV